MAANAGVNRVELRSGSRHRGDAHDRNERGDQAIFNGGHAGLVLEKTSDKVLHRYSSEVIYQPKRRVAAATI